MLLENKNAIIYGGGGSVGGGTARTFAKEGARVFLAGRTRASLDKVANEITDDGGAAEVAVLDALDENAVDEHARSVVERAGSIDVSFNVVPRGDVQGIPLVEMTTADLTRAVTTGLTSNFITARAAARQMIKQGSGVILALDSGSAKGAAPMMGSTSPADAVTDSLVRSLATELGPHGVRVLGIWVAGIPETLTPEKIAATNAEIQLDEAGLQAMINGLDQMRVLPRSPRLAEIAETAETAAFLASDRAYAITGSFINAKRHRHVPLARCHKRGLDSATRVRARVSRPSSVARQFVPNYLVRS